MLKCYRPPSTSNPSTLWSQSILKLPSSCQPLFDTFNLKNLFMSLHLWREEKSTLCDMSPNQFIPIDKLALITRAKPTTVSNLNSLYNSAKKWPSEYLCELLKLIKDNESQVMAISEPIPSAKNLFLPDYCSDISDTESEWSVEDMVIEVQNNFPTPAVIPVPNPLPKNLLLRNSDNLKYLSGSNRKNVMKRIRLWGNRFKRNQERVAKGLIPIRYHKCKGKKHQARQAERRERQSRYLQRASYSDSFF
jgi:hypothetical protein